MNKFRKPHGGNREGGGFDRKGGRPSFGGRPPFQRDGNRGFGSGEKYDAICAHCGKACQVPFRPNGKKPVYCKDCFNRDRAAMPQNTFGPVNAPPVNAPRLQTEDTKIDELKRQVNALNIKIDRVLEIVTTRKATEERPVQSEPKVKALPAKKKLARKK